MAVSRSKTWVAGEILTASDLNGEFNNILNNGEDLGWPATKAKDFDGQVLTLDADADSTLTADTDDRLDLALAGTDLFRWDGTVATPVNGLDWIAGAAGSAVQVQAVGSDTNISINIVPKGTGRLQEDGTAIPSGVRLQDTRRQAGLSLFKAQTARAMAMENAGNMTLATQVFY